MNKKTRKIWIGISIIGILILVLAVTGNLTRFLPFSVVTSSTFVKPLWARLECAPTDAYEGLQTLQVPKTGMSVLCGQNEFTDLCKVYAVNIPTTWYSDNVKIRYQECNNDGTNCESTFQTRSVREGASREFIKDINKGRKLFIFFERTLFNINVEGTASKEYRPWQLYRFVGGSKFIARSGSCSITGSDALSRIPSDSTYPNPLTMTGGEGSKWVNYVDDWAYGPATNVFTHPNYGEVYCSAARIYDIVELQFKDGSLKKVDPNYKSSRADGEIVNGLGKMLASVDCCPNEPTCGADFKYKPVDTGTSCFSDIQCPNAAGPIPKSSTTYVKWSCINSKCVESAPITVECTTSSQCASGQICDLSTTNYGKCIQQAGAPFCGDNICQVDEGQGRCVVDCGPGEGGGICENCFSWLFSKAGTAQCEAKPDYKVWGFLPIPFTSQDAVCPYVLIITLGIIGIFTAVMIKILRKKKRR